MLEYNMMCDQMRVEIVINGFHFSYLADAYFPGLIIDTEEFDLNNRVYVEAIQLASLLRDEAMARWDEFWAARMDAINNSVHRSAAHEERQKKAGYVYILHSKDYYQYKIGMTKNKRDRSRALAIQMPFEIEWDLIIKTDDCKRVESTLHRLFAPKRINGEWFNLTFEDVDKIRQHYQAQIEELTA